MDSAALDANVAIGLACGDVFDHLQALSSPVLISPGVTQEVLKRVGRPGSKELLAAVGTWVTEVTSPPPSSPGGSACVAADDELVAIADYYKVDFVLTADRVVARNAAAVGIPSFTAPQLVAIMKGKGLIAEVRPVLDLMRQRGFGIDARTYGAVLLSAGETP